MKKNNNIINGPDQRGRYTSLPEIDGIEITVGGPKLRDGPYRAGSFDSKDSKMEEAETPGGIADANDEQVRNAAVEEFANKIKAAVSARLMGKKTNLKLKGHKDLVVQIANMIKMETEYLNALITGQSSDTPALQKNKALIDMEAKKLDRMMGTSNFWPFK